MTVSPDQQFDLLTEILPAEEARLIAGLPEDDVTHEPVSPTAQAEADATFSSPVSGTVAKRSRREIQPTENEADAHWNSIRTAREILSRPIPPRGAGYAAAVAMSRAIAKGHENTRLAILRGLDNPAEYPIEEPDDDEVA